MNATETHVLDDSVTANAGADPGAGGPLAEQQYATIALSTALNDMQNSGARLLAGWRASLERQGQLEAELAQVQHVIATAVAESSSGLPDQAIVRLRQWLDGVR